VVQISSNFVHVRKFGQPFGGEGGDRADQIAWFWCRAKFRRIFGWVSGWVCVVRKEGQVKLRLISVTLMSYGTLSMNGLLSWRNGEDSQKKIWLYCWLNTNWLVVRKVGSDLNEFWVCVGLTASGLRCGRDRKVEGKLKSSKNFGPNCEFSKILNNRM
jgi:hypothetical protein